MPGRGDGVVVGGPVYDMLSAIFFKLFRIRTDRISCY